MLIDTLQMSLLRIPFRQTFRHASAERAQTQTLWVQATGRSGCVGHGESCPREYVTRESLDSTQDFIATHQAEWRSTLSDLASIRDWVASHQAEIDAQPSAWAAVELALLDLLGQEQHRSVESLLDMDELQGRFQYTAVLGDAEPKAFEAQLGQYLKAGFRQFKIKLSGDMARDASKATALKAAGIAPQAVRADANNLWADADAALSHLLALDYSFFAIEEPLAAGDYAGMATIADASGCRIILDESLLRVQQLQQLPGRDAGSPRWIVNLRVSKMGGLIRSLALVQALRQSGAIGIIIGAHVGETSLLTRAALTVAQAARDILLAQEGAFGTHLLAHDVIEPPLMFGAAGMLDVSDHPIAGRPGFGLTPRLPAA